MLKNKKYFLTAILVMIFGLFLFIPGSEVNAASGEGWYLDDNTGVLTISKNDFNIDYTSLKNFKKDIKSVIISEGVTTVGYGGLDYLTNMTSVSFPSTMTNVNNSAFVGCTSLRSVILPEGVKKIYPSAFADCSAIETLVLPSTLQEISIGAFRGCESIKGTLVIPEGITYIGTNTFSGCKSLTGVSFPSTLTSLGGGSFSGCTSLTSVVIPQNCTFIDSTFSGCTNLKTVKFSYGLKTLYARTFGECSSLTEVILPSSVTSIGHWTFENCTSLKNLVVLNSAASISSYAGTLGTTNTTVHCLRYSNAHSHAEKKGQPVHFLNEPVVTRAATPSSFGERAYYCATCNRNFTEEILPLELGKTDVTAVNNTGSSVQVTWNPVDGAAGYKVYRKQSGSDYVLYTTTTWTSFTDTAVTAGTYYTYKVEAYNSLQSAGAGKEMSITFTTRPVISSLSSTSKGVKVAWKKVAGAYRYGVYRNGKLVARTTSTSYTDGGAKKNGTSYKYYIVAYKNRYGTTLSQSDAVRTYYLMSQKITKLTNKKGKKLQVKYGKNNRGTGYEVQYSTNKSFKKSVTKTAKVTKKKTTTKTIGKLKKNKTYYVRVRTYLKKSGKTYYSAWSSKKKIKIKK